MLGCKTLIFKWLTIVVNRCGYSHTCKAIKILGKNGCFCQVAVPKTWDDGEWLVT